MTAPSTPAASSTLTDAALPRELYTAEQVRALDRCAIESQGVSGAQLMWRAGRAAFRALRARWPDAAALQVVCGTGNNGGDGFVIAQLAHEQQLPVCVWQVGEAARISGDAAAARGCALAAGVTVRGFNRAAFATASTADAVIVDALLGTGLSAGVDGTVREPFAEAIAAINVAGSPVLAVDIPSGLSADSGAVLGRAVRADLTATFIGLKRGLFTGNGPACVGELVFDDLTVPAAVYATQIPLASRLQLPAASGPLTARARDAHKGHFGHALLIGGDHGMGGAPLMASEAAARVGAGLVSCATRPEHAGLLTLRRPEIMARGVRSGAELAPLLARASCIGIGPGLGTAGWGEQLLARTLTTALPLVVDADALNLLAARPICRRDNWVLTPHPGEAGRLLGCSTAAVQADRFAAAAALREKFGGVVVLKGAGTLVAGPSGVAVSNFGNPGMASGGMGDVLTGVITGLIAQGLPVERAARIGVAVHGRAADLAAVDGERGLLATDLMAPLRRLVNP